MSFPVLIRYLRCNCIIKPVVFIDVENTKRSCEEANRFKCETGGECVQQNDVCDGTLDCSLITEGHYRDELNCGTMFSIDHPFGCCLIHKKLWRRFHSPNYEYCMEQEDPFANCHDMESPFDVLIKEIRMNFT